MFQQVPGGAVTLEARAAEGCVWGRRIRPFINALALIGLFRGQVIVGVTDVHVPRDRVVDMVSESGGTVNRLGTSVWAPAHMIDHRGGSTVVVRSDDTCTQTGRCQAAAHQHRRCPRCGQPIHDSEFPLRPPYTHGANDLHDEITPTKVGTDGSPIKRTCVLARYLPDSARLVRSARDCPV